MTFTVLLLTHEGIEELASEECRALCKGSPEIAAPGILRVAASEKELARLCYGTRLAERVLLELSASPTQDIRTMLAGVPADVGTWLKGRSFKVSCIKRAPWAEDMSSQELAGLAGGALLERCPGANVKMDAPDVEVVLLLHPQGCALGLDLAGFDLSRRDYRIFDHSRSVRCTLAAAAFRFSGWKDPQEVLDPICQGGILAIEGVLAAAKRPVHRFQKEKFGILRLFPEALSVMEELDAAAQPPEAAFHVMDATQHYVGAAKKNAKLADVEKLLRFSRSELSWLDVKFTEGQLGLVLTQLPQAGKAIPEDKLNILVNELFYQAKYSLSKKGALVLITADPLLPVVHAEKHGFRLEKELLVSQGKVSFALQRWRP